MSDRPNRQQQRHARRVQRERDISYQAALALVRKDVGAAPSSASTRVCWWCDADGPLTREHVIARWMVHALHGDGLLDHAYAEPGADEPTRTWSKVHPDFVAKVACPECNNGWMATLEGHARPLVTSLMGGGPRRLSRVDAEVVGRWGAKTALMFQALEPAANRVVPHEIYDQLRAVSVLPSTLRVWAARVDALGVFQHTFSGNIAHHDRRARMFTSLVTFDRLALMVMGSPDPELLQALQLGHLRNAWVELGAIGRGVPWPGPFSFDTTNFMAMPQLLPKLATIPPGTRLPSAHLL